MNTPQSFVSARWIWPAAIGAPVNQYVEFSHEFQANDPAQDAELLLSADSNYAAWLNGEFIHCGQFSDYPDRKTFDRLALTGKLRKGLNTLNILVHYLGEDHFSYIKGNPGLIYAIQCDGTTLVSGTDTRWRPAAAYRSGPLPRITAQLGPGFEFDARREGEWQQITAADIAATSQLRMLEPRPIPKLRIHGTTPAVVQAQGMFRRATVPDQSVGQQMQTDFLSPRHRRDIFVTSSEGNPALPSAEGLGIKPENFADDGFYLLLDLGREEVGFLDLDVDTNAGAVLDIAWGEHLDDLRVRAYIGERSFATRYVCRAGRQTFSHYLTRLAGRYLQIHVSNATGKFLLYRAGLRPAEYPVEMKGQFQSADSLQNRVYETARRTLHLCMHEHYEDCPWREQALYANDGRNQALAGYYAFGEYDFPATSFRLLAEGLKNDGFLEMCAPAVIHLTIPSFTMAWFLAVQDHYRHAADLAFVRRMMPYIRKIMDTHLARMTEDLLPAMIGKRYWHFYDWAEGLDNWDKGPAPGEVRFDAPLNALFCLALEASADLADAIGETGESGRYRTAARKVRSAFHDWFWDPANAAYATYRGGKAAIHFDELTQSLAILAGVVPEAIKGQLLQRLVAGNNGLVETTLSQALYKFEALLTRKQDFGRWIFDKIARDWGAMLFNGATSFWETRKGGWDFDNAGSLCHGWSATPVYFYGAYLLGIKPLTPGFRTFSVDPLPGIVPAAAGTVPTPAGPIRVRWKKRGDKILCRLAHPQGTKPEVPNPAVECRIEDPGL